MTQSPLKIFNLVGNEIRIETVAMDDVYPHSTTRINPRHPNITRKKTNLAGELERVAQMARQAGHEIAVVQCGVGNPAQESCEQKQFVVPVDQVDGLVTNTRLRLERMEGAVFSRIFGK